ncbi:MAG: hypothetical protein HUU08_03015 [Candidatus Brocadia sp.]|nr:hypothetical protein [Candidatus Brocadia sp.]
MRAVIIGAFIDGNFFALFPGKEHTMAIRAEEVGKVFTESFTQLEKMSTDLAFKLSSLFAIIVVQVSMRGVTERTNGEFWNSKDVRVVTDSFKRFAVCSLIFSQEEFVIFRLLRGGNFS